MAAQTRRARGARQQRAVRGNGHAHIAQCHATD